MNNPFIEKDNSNNNIEYKLTITNDAINRLKKIFAEEKNKVFRIMNILSVQYRSICM